MLPLWVVVAVVVLLVALAFAASVVDAAGLLEPTVVDAVDRLVVSLVDALVQLVLVAAVPLWLDAAPQYCFEPERLAARMLAAELLIHVDGYLVRQP